MLDLEVKYIEVGLHFFSLYIENGKLLYIHIMAIYLLE